MPTPKPVARSGFDYAKWDRLEISDDEAGICLAAAGVFVPAPGQTTFHPNLDKGLNIRVNRITRERKEDEIDEDAPSQVGSIEPIERESQREPERARERERERESESE